MGLRELKNWIRIQLGKIPICPKCGEKMVKKGYPKDGFVQHYKCLECGHGTG